MHVKQQRNNTFQMVTIALSGLYESALVDDIIIFGCCIHHHNDNLIKLFCRLRQYNLKFNPEKCVSFKHEVL